MELDACGKVSVKPDGGVGRWNVVLFWERVCVCVCVRNLLHRYVRTYCPGMRAAPSAHRGGTGGW